MQKQYLGRVTERNRRSDGKGENMKFGGRDIEGRDKRD